MYTALSKPLTISGLDNVKDNGDSAYSVTKYEYDRFGKLLSKIDPLGNLENYQYDLLGNVVKKTDRNKSTIDMTYDGLNRVLATKVTTADGKGNTATAYDYTLTGQRKTMVSGGVTTTSYYDDLGRLKQEQDTSGIIKQYDYDSANNRTLFVLKKNGSEISNTSYNYDNQSRIKDVLNKGKVIATYTYDYNGNRDALTYSNGNSAKYEYNLANKITQLTNKKGLSILSNYSYSYNLDGNRAGENEAVKAKNKAYEYDGLGRLTTEAENSQLAANYDYDDNNNRNKMVMPDSFADFENSFKDTVYTYNGINQLTNITIGTLNAAYGYNGDGLRTSKVVDGIKTTHILDGQNIAAEIDGQGKTTEYIRGINLIASVEGANIKFYLYNGHGDVVHITDSTGNVIKNYEYDAFGNEKNIDVNDKNPFRYGGEYFDKETGLIYLRARYYDPKIGRFINEDSVWGKDNDPLSFNLYTYCNSNPIYYFDSSGNSPEAVLPIAAGFALADGPLPIGDAIGGTIIVGFSIYKWITKDKTVTVSNPKTNVKPTPIPTPKPPKPTLPERIAAITAASTAINENIKDWGIGTYKNMVTLLKNTGLQAHHILEKRFASVLGIKDSNLMRSIAVTPEQHRLFTNAWRTAIGYVNSKGEWITTSVEKMDVYNTALDIYKDFPAIIKIIQRAIKVNGK